MANTLREALEIVRRNRAELSKTEQLAVVKSEMDKVATVIRNELLATVLAGIEAIHKPEDGKPGKDGKDSPQMPEILEKIKEELPEIIEQRGPQTFSLIGRRSRAHFKIVDISGTKDGSNRQFFLSEPAPRGSQIFAFLNGQYLHLGTHYSVSGVQFTYKDTVAAPKSTWNHYAIIFKA